MRVVDVCRAWASTVTRTSLAAVAWPVSTRVASQKCRQLHQRNIRLAHRLHRQRLQPSDRLTRRLRLRRPQPRNQPTLRLAIQREVRRATQLRLLLHQPMRLHLFPLVHQQRLQHRRLTHLQHRQLLSQPSIRLRPRRPMHQLMLRRTRQRIILVPHRPIHQRTSQRIILPMRQLMHQPLCLQRCL